VDEPTLAEVGVTEGDGYVSPELDLPSASERLRVRRRSSEGEAEALEKDPGRLKLAGISVHGTGR
jgi:hypothetical protein